MYSDNKFMSILQMNLSYMYAFQLCQKEAQLVISIIESSF